MKLEAFVKEHRRELDAFEPAEQVWQAINAGMQQPSFLIKSKLSWLKYLVAGTSMVVALGYTGMYMNENRQTGKQAYYFEENVIAGNPLMLGMTAAQDTPEKTRVVDMFPAMVKALKDTPGSYAPAFMMAPFMMPAIETPVFVTPDFVPPAEVMPLNIDTAMWFTPQFIIPALTLGPAPVSCHEADSIRDQRARSKKISGDYQIRADTVFSGVKTLEISGSFMDINIKAQPGDQVRFKASASVEKKGLVFGDEKYELKYERKDSVLKIILITEGRQVMLGGMIRHEALFDLDVPPSTNIILRTNYGNVNMEGLEGRICDVHTHSGHVHACNINTNLNLKMNYGNLSLCNIKGDIRAAVNSGHISASNVNGDVDVSGSYGNQTYKNIRGDMKLRSHSGHISVCDLQGDAHMRTDYGNITLENVKGVFNMHTYSGHISGKQVELTDNLEVKTSYGNITMSLLNDLESLSFDLRAAYGNINIDKNGTKMQSSQSLNLNRGRIQVKGVTVSGHQTYR